MNGINLILQRENYRYTLELYNQKKTNYFLSWSIDIRKRSIQMRKVDFISMNG